MNDKSNTIRIIATVISVTICVLVLFLGYRTYHTNQKMMLKYKSELTALRSSNARLENQFAELKIRQEEIEISVSDKTALLAPEKTLQLNKNLPTGDGQDKKMQQEKMIRQLLQIIQSTGLDKLAASGDLDPSILSRIYEEYEQRDEASSYHEKMLNNNRELHQSDRDNYSQDIEELNSLYERARLRRGKAGNAQEREEAFNELLTKFPYAYVTGLAIGERALFSAFRRENSETEAYYNMLTQTQNFENLVTDRGAEVMPNLEQYMAYAYIQEGRIDEARAMIDSLGNKYPDSFVIIPGVNRRFERVPVRQVIEDLSRLIQ
jgi:hypothetical protein